MVVAVVAVTWSENKKTIADAQAYIRLKAENDRSRLAAVEKSARATPTATPHSRSTDQQKRAVVGGGWGGRQRQASISASGDVTAVNANGRRTARDNQRGVATTAPTKSTVWHPPAGDPYQVATARFRAAEGLSPFTFLEREPLTCPRAHLIASSTSHPNSIFDTASCFDYCAGLEDCGCVCVGGWCVVCVWVLCGVWCVALWCGLCECVECAESVWWYAHAWHVCV